MFKTYITTIIALLIISSSLYAQDEIIVSLAPGPLLSKTDFMSAEVIDARLDKTKIGTLKKVLSSKKVNANFPCEFSAYLNITLAKILPPKDHKIPLVFIIHKLKVTEFTVLGDNYGYCKTILEVAKESDSLLYSLGIFESEIYKRISPLSHSSDLRIIKTIKNCLKALKKTDWKNYKGQLIDRENLQYKYNFRQVPKKGIYTSFGQLCRNTPRLSNISEAKKAKRKSKNPEYHFDKEFSDFGNRIKFVSDGEDIYFHKGNGSFIKSKQHGRFIYFESKLSPAQASHRFGLFGGSTSSLKIRSLILDTKTGLMSEIDGYGLHTISKEYPEIVRDFKKTKMKRADMENAIKQLNAKFE